MVAYLRERAAEEVSLKEKDLELKAKQVEKEAVRQQLLDRQHNGLMGMLLKQQQQKQQFQQQQQQKSMQMQTYMVQQQQQQQQHQMLMAILEKMQWDKSWCNMKQRFKQEKLSAFFLLLLLASDAGC